MLATVFSTLALLVTDAVCLTKSDHVISEGKSAVLADMLAAETLPGVWTNDAKSRLLAIQMPYKDGQRITAKQVRDDLAGRVPGLEVELCRDENDKILINSTLNGREAQAMEPRGPAVLSPNTDLTFKPGILEVNAGRVRVERRMTFLENPENKDVVFILVGDETVMSVPTDGQFVRVRAK